LPRRTYTIIRVDGKAFHTLTRNFRRPFDHEFMFVMDQTAINMCKQIQGAQFAYVQSDEISILLTDFDSPQTCAWFDGNVQKMASISAAIATAEFNKAFATAAKTANEIRGTANEYMTGDYGQLKTGYFDSRVFTIPDPVEVENYFIWRQQDASRNSIQMAARSVYSHKQLEGKNTSELHNMLFAKDINWNDYWSGEKRGRVIKKDRYVLIDTETAGVSGELEVSEPVYRTRWVSYDGTGMENEIPVFTQDRSFLRKLIPLNTEIIDCMVDEMGG